MSFITLLVYKKKNIKSYFFSDSVHGVPVFESTKCFKWKYTPSYDTDAVVPNSERDGKLIQIKLMHKNF